MVNLSIPFAMLFVYTGEYVSVSTVPVGSYL